MRTCSGRMTVIVIGVPVGCWDLKILRCTAKVSPIDMGDVTKITLRRLRTKVVRSAAPIHNIV